MFRSRYVPTVLLAGLVMLGASGRLRAAQAVEKTQAEASKFLRFVDDNDGGGTLETSIVTYQNNAGVKVHLVAAVHVGETRYYQGLNKTFAGYDALLYEMVKPRGMDVPNPGERSGSFINLIQRAMKEALELDFQLDAVNYRAKNFVHADLDAETFSRMQADRGESIFLLMLKQMLAEMSKPQQVPDVTMAELLVALTSPDRARHFKLMLARQFEDLEEKLSGLEGPGGSVLVTERNKAAVRVLKQSLTDGRKDIGIFYGAAHMKGISEMVEEMGFRPVNTEWRIAWDMTPKEGDIVIKKVTKKPATRPAE